MLKVNERMIPCVEKEIPIAVLQLCGPYFAAPSVSALNDLKGFEMPRQSGPKSNFRCKLLIINRITALSRFAEPFQNLSNHFKSTLHRGALSRNIGRLFCRVAGNRPA